jgi:hypothetical protein
MRKSKKQNEATPREGDGPALKNRAAEGETPGGDAAYITW